MICVKTPGGSLSTTGHLGMLGIFLLFQTPLHNTRKKINQIVSLTD